MRRWLIGRLFGFAPTFGLVLLVVFAVVNLVPAVPLISDDGEEVSFQAAYDEFRGQFGLDRPVFLNFRHFVDIDDVREMLDEIGAATDAFERLDPTMRLVDHRRFVLAELVAIADGTSEDAPRRELARGLLPKVAAAAGLPGTGPGSWTSWREEHRASLHPGPLERLRITFLETRFGAYVSNLLRLDFGMSMMDQRPVLGTMLGRLVHSVTFVTLSIVLAYLLAIPIGAWSAHHRGTRRERWVSLLLFAAYSFPTYLAATLLIRFLSLGDPFDWFPVGGVRSMKGYEELSGGERVLDRLHHMVLPVFCMTYVSLAILSRYARDSVLEVLGSDFVRLARAKGMPERTVLFRHALRNGLLPILTLVGEALPAIFGGAVIIEILFEIPGIGSYVFESIQNADYNAILLCTLVSALLTLAGILLSDVLYALADPRVRFDGAESSESERIS